MMLSPPDDGDRSRSDISQGSHIGKNKIFVPHLSFPHDINVDPREKRNVHQRPKGENPRFSLKKSTTGQIAGPAAKKGYGKKAKLLEFNIGTNNNDLQDEPAVEIERMPAARGVANIHKPSADDVLAKQQEGSLGGDSIKSNKIKKISFLKG